MLRRVIYIVSALVASGAIGYVLGVGSGGTAAPAPPPAATASAAQPTQPTGVDWTRFTDQDITVAQVFLTARDVGIEAALDSLVTITAADPAVARRGHQLAHALGRYVIARNGNDPAILARCRPLFQAGCYHGVLEGYLASVAEVDSDRLTGMCAALSPRGTAIISARECAHGLGHGLIDRLGYEFRPALRACDAFDSAALREECHDGIFMQNIAMGAGLPTATGAEAAEGESHQHGAGEHAAHAQTAGFREDDLTFPCSSVDERYQPSCWSYQVIAIRRFLRDVGPRALFACDLAPQASRARCYAGFGKQTLARYDNDQNAMIDLCTLALPPNDDHCLGGVVEVLIDREWGPENAIAFCERVRSYGEDPSGCWGVLGERISLLHARPEETEAVCARAGEPQLVQACRAGARRGRS